LSAEEPDNDGTLFAFDIKTIAHSGS